MIEFCEEIQDFGKDTFIGREVFKDGSETYVTLNLRSLGSISYKSLEMACDELCDAVKMGDRVLLSQSPGQVEPRTWRASHCLDVLKSALEERMGEVDAYIVVDQSQREETYTIDGRRYEPFKAEQMTLLQKMYKDKPEMKNFPNPFGAQPIIH